MLHYLLLLLISLSPQKKQEKNNKEIIIALERTACYGDCPVYKIEIYKDNSGIYHGKRFVQKIGYYNFQLTKSEVLNILQTADDIEFNKMKNEYIEAISDLPTTFICIKEKKIKDYFGAPKTLKELEELIDRTTQKNLDF